VPLRDALAHPDFQALEPAEQLDFVHGELLRTAGDLYKRLSLDEQREFATQEIRRYSPPRGGSLLEMVPLVGSELRDIFYGPEKVYPGEDLPLQETGRGLEDLFLITGAGSLVKSLLGAARTIPQRIGAEALTGTIYETHKLLFDPPKTPGEAVERVAGGTAAFAVGGALFGALPELVGRFARNRMVSRALASELGSTQARDSLFSRLNAGQVDQITDDELRAVLRVSERSKSESAQSLGDAAKQLLQQNEQKRRLAGHGATWEAYDIEQERFAQQTERVAQQESGRVQSEQLAQSIQEQRIGEQLREADVSAQERLARREGRTRLTEEEAEQFRIRESGRIQAESTAERLATERVQTQLREADVEARGRVSVLDEQQRQQAANAEIAAATEGVTPKTSSERMLMDAMRNPELAQQGFVGRDPVTLPIVMIRETPEGGVPVVVERFTDGQALGRRTGYMPRAQLRMPRDDIERALVERMRIAQQVEQVPTRDQALGILRARASAEQDKRLADLHALRPDAALPNVAEQEFELRRASALNLLRATNSPTSVETLNAITTLRPIAGSRQIASVENVKLREAEHVANALAGAGYGNVRLAVSPEGTVDISLTRGTSDAENALASLYHRYVTRDGVIDPTTHTYAGLDIEEHKRLGRGFGLTEKQVNKYISLMQGYFEDMNARGIRVPADVATLGVNTIDAQVQKPGAAREPIRPDAIVDADRLQRIEVGDTVTMPLGGKQHHFAVNAEGREPTGERILFLQSLEKDTLGTQTGPLRESALRAGGVQRDVARPIGADPTAPMAQHSPARTLEELLDPSARRPMEPPVEARRHAIEQAARDIGLTAHVTPNNAIIRAGGLKFEFGSLQDAADFVTGIKRLRVERDKLIELLGGEGCLR
jgi:hypothetical protein